MLEDVSARVVTNLATSAIEHLRTVPEQIRRRKIRSNLEKHDSRRPLAHRTKKGKRVWLYAQFIGEPVEVHDSWQEIDDPPHWWPTSCRNDQGDIVLRRIPAASLCWSTATDINTCVGSSTTLGTIPEIERGITWSTTAGSGNNVSDRPHT